MYYSLVNKATGIVENKIIGNNFVPQDNYSLVESTESTGHIGDSWDGYTFTAIAPVLTGAQKKQAIVDQLNALDRYIPLSIEDYWNSVGFDTTKLPQKQQDRLTKKQQLRTQYNSIID